MIAFAWNSIWIFGLIYLAILIFKPSAKRTYQGVVFGLLCTFLLSVPGTESAIVETLRSSGSMDQNWNLLWVMYAAGVLVQGFRYTKSYSRVRKIRISSQPNLNLDVQMIFDQIKKVLNLPKIDLRFSAEVEIPMVVGYLKPVIIYPVGLINHLNAEQTEAVLVHEIQHVINRDYLWNLVICILEILLFFNPFIYAVHAYIKDIREEEADQKAASYQDNPLILARTLLTLEQFASGPIMAVAAKTNSGELTRRVHKLIGKKTKQEIPVKSSFLGIGILLFMMWWTSQISKDHTSTQLQQEVATAMDSIFLPDYKQRIKSIEFKTTYGKITDLKVNDQELDHITEAQHQSLEKKKLPQISVEDNKLFQYESGLIKKFEKNEKIRSKEKKEEQKQIMVSSTGKNTVDLAKIEGYQYGKSHKESTEEFIVITERIIEKETEQNNSSILIEMKTLELGKHVEFEFNSELLFIVSLLEADLSLEEGVAEILRYYLDEDFQKFELMVLGSQAFLDGEELDQRIADVLTRYVQSHAAKNNENNFVKIINR